MRRKTLGFALLLFSAAVTSCNLHRPSRDDRIGEVCVVPAPTGAEAPRLEAGSEVYVYVYLRGSQGECISSTSLSSVPAVETNGPTKWSVKGAFVDAAPERPRTPDCGGGVSMATLGHLRAGTYEVESTIGLLRFEIPSPEERICVSPDGPAG